MVSINNLTKKYPNYEIIIDQIKLTLHLQYSSLILDGFF